MDSKITQPQQLNLLFEELSPLQNAPKGEFSILMAVSSNPEIASEVTAVSAVVFDFRSEALKREEASRASLYRRILDSVKHIG